MKKVLSLLSIVLLGLLLVGCVNEETPSTPLVPLEPSTPITPIIPIEPEGEDVFEKYVSGEKYEITQYTFNTNGKTILTLNNAELLQSSNAYINMVNLKLDTVDFNFEGYETDGTNFEATKDFLVFKTTNSKVIIDTYNSLGALRIRVSKDSGSIEIDVSGIHIISFGLQSNASTGSATVELSLK